MAEDGYKHGERTQIKNPHSPICAFYEPYVNPLEQKEIS